MQGSEKPVNIGESEKTLTTCARQDLNLHAVRHYHLKDFKRMGFAGDFARLFSVARFGATSRVDFWFWLSDINPNLKSAVRERGLCGGDASDCFCTSDE